MLNQSSAAPHLPQHRDLMKMFKKFVAVAAALLAVILIGGASLTRADAAGTDTGPCITAVWAADPNIKAQRGNCTVVENAPEDSTARSWVVLVSGLNVEDPALAGVPFHVKAVNQVSGKVLTDQSGTVDQWGIGSVNINEYLMQPASAPLPSYLITLTIGGKTYTYTIGADSFVKGQTDADPAGDVTSYESAGRYHFTNEVISSGRGW